MNIFKDFKGQCFVNSVEKGRKRGGYFIQS